MDLNFILSTAILIFFVLDPFGNVPLVLTILKDVPAERRRKIIVREVLIGLVILLLFLFFGNEFLSIFHLETEAVQISGGVIFFIIGMRMIFPADPNQSLFAAQGEPFIVPIAMPMIAGPSALATLLVLSKNNADAPVSVTLALLAAWGASFLILIAAPFMYRWLRRRGLTALERLMGMLLLFLSVQMFIDGIRGLLV
jgi:multiple antibiotic resistance protein